jgi:hypothetical protein
VESEVITIANPHKDNCERIVIRRFHEFTSIDYPAQYQRPIDCIETFYILSLTGTLSGNLLDNTLNRMINPSHGDSGSFDN